jgi:hypothetical protein
VRQEHALFALSYCSVATPSCNRVNKILQLSINVFIAFSLWRSERANKETIKASYLHSKQQRSILTRTGMFINDATLQIKMFVKFSENIAVVIRSYCENQRYLLFAKWTHNGEVLPHISSSELSKGQRRLLCLFVYANSYGFVLVQYIPYFVLVWNWTLVNFLDNGLSYKKWHLT